MLVTRTQTPCVQGGMNGRLSVVDDSFLQGAAFVIANGDLLRVKDDGRQSKGDRNKEATEFQ